MQKSLSFLGPYTVWLDYQFKSKNGASVSEVLILFN